MYIKNVKKNLYWLGKYFVAQYSLVSTQTYQIKVVIEIPQMWLHVTVGAQLPEENIATVEYF